MNILVLGKTKETAKEFFNGLLAQYSPEYSNISYFDNKKMLFYIRRE